jgi:Leucine-rich repeat (LRR) protein
MKKLFVLFLAISFQSITLLASKPIKVYSWEEALNANPDSVFAISFEKLKLDSLPQTLSKFKNIQRLNLSKNKLTHLPDFIKDFENLTELNLDKNRFVVFPIQICSMKKLEKLIVSRNEFTQIPECIQYAVNLGYLDLSDTPVSTFPEAFVLMPNLKTLSLHGIAYPPSFHVRWKERLPWMRIEFDAPCNCME